ncbi:sialomucin core protein 24-like [Antennarius striatus]|uniref:sialomucin core protein 24-like n=1 Tax=Antennarius striatus TaxID=241820 RepID=UPI0035AF137A
MDVISAALACCLLALSSAVTQPGKGHLTIAPTERKSDLSPLTNQTHNDNNNNNNNNNNNITATVTLPNSTTDATVTSNLSGNTTPFTRSPWHNETFTRTKADTSPPQASPSTPVVTPPTNSSPLVTTTHTLTPPFTATTTPAEQTTVSRTSTPDTTATNSSVTVRRSSDSSDRNTQALPLNLSDHTMTILLSIVLGVLALASVLLILHKCKHKIQILHEPLDNSDDLDPFAADDDTLVISGGLYDGHPIYDNPPAGSQDQSQLRLEFLQ